MRAMASIYSVNDTECFSITDSYSTEAAVEDYY